MIVGICKLDLKLDGHRSLKEKRKVLRTIKDSVFSRFKIPIAEVGHNDLWQRTELGFAVVGNSKQKLNSVIDKVLDYISDSGLCFIIDSQYEFIHFTD